MKIKSNILLFFITIFFQNIAFSQSGSILGKILDAETQASVAAVSVYLENENVLLSTNSSGEFAIPNLEKGTYDLTIFIIGSP